MNIYLIIGINKSSKGNPEVVKLVICEDRKAIGIGKNSVAKEK